MSCPRCGTESRPDQRFCKNCGAPLATAETAPAAVGNSAGTAAPQPPSAPQPPPASTHAIPDGGLTFEDVVAWLQSAGYSARVVTAESGNRHIVSSSEGSPFNVFTGDCKGDRCASLEFAAGFSTAGKFDISLINDWNSNNRWCKAYYDNVNDPWLGMDIDLWPGGTYESLNDQFTTWNSTLGRFIAKYSLR